MPNILQKLTGIDSPMFSIGMTEIEKATGNSGLDARLIADILSGGHRVMRRLGLDPRDTTGREFYHALVATSKKQALDDLLFDTDFVLIEFDSQVVSCNLIDVIENVHHEMKYEDQIITHGRRALIGELVDRYITHNRTNVETVVATFQSMGLLSSDDACYNITKYKHKH